MFMKLTDRFTDEELAEGETASCINMLHVMYLWLPMIFNLLITLILTRLNVEKAVEDLKK